VLRPEHLRVDPVGGAGGLGGEVLPSGAVAGVVDSVAAMGSHVAVTVTVHGVQLAARCAGVLEPWMHVGATVWVSLAAQSVHLIAGDAPARVPG
jgi:ABC-type sugar transport system ATPase subunit